MTEQIEKALSARWQIVLYRGVLQDPLVKKFINLLEETARPEPVLSQVLPCYYDFAGAFIATAAKVFAKEGQALDNAWHDYLLDLILHDENLFSREAEITAYKDISSSLKKMAQQDLHNLQMIASVSSVSVRNALAAKLGNCREVENLPGWEGVYLKAKPDNSGKGSKDDPLGGFRRLRQWEKGLQQFSEFYRENSVGIFSRYHAFRWVRSNGEGTLVGVSNPDIIQMNQLYEYEREQAKIIQNTEQFLRGYAANNVLLYGDRGTGKSSTVKALINLYGKKGLRLIEIQKQDLGDFPIIVAQLAGRPLKFILFVDDLSFSEQEGQYRELKALLEGGLEARPKNVLVYATSNRRHLVQENFADREITGYDPFQDDVRHMDTLQEKLSLADRFGISVTFAAPDQKRYLTIVEKMARERKLDISREELEQRALKWEMSFNARSARTARQFIDYLEGQLALEREYAQI